MPVETNNKNKAKPPRFKQFGGSFVILLTLLLVLNLVVPSLSGPKLPQVPYSDFITQVQAGRVDRAVVGNDRIQYSTLASSIPATSANFTPVLPSE